MVVLFFEVERPIRENVDLVAHLVSGLDGDKGFDAICPGETEIPTYLQSYASTLVADG